MVFHCRLSGSKSPQVSRTLLSILAVFNSAVVWMVSTRPPIVHWDLTQHLESFSKDILLRSCFFFLNRNICCVKLYFSVSLDSDVPGNRNFFCFCYWFWLVFIPFFIIQYSIVFTYFPINIIFRLLCVSLYSFGVRTEPPDTKWSIDSVFVHKIYIFGLIWFSLCVPDRF